MQQVDGVTIPWKICHGRFAESKNKKVRRYAKRLDKKSICVQFKNGTDACQGDSGGPLYLIDHVEAKKVKQELDDIMGIVSWGYQV